MQRRSLIAIVMVALVSSSGCDAMPDFVLETLKSSTQAAIETAVQDAVGEALGGALGGIIEGELPLDGLDIDGEANDAAPEDPEPEQSD